MTLLHPLSHFWSPDAVPETMSDQASVTHSLASLDVEADACTSPRYWYTGTCLTTGKTLRLPRTARAEAIAHGLMAQLAHTDGLAAQVQQVWSPSLRQCLENEPAQLPEGKMYGVLLVALPTGEQRVLKAFSGCWEGQALVPGWVPPIPGREQVADAEARTLADLDRMKQQLIHLQDMPERGQYAQQVAVFEEKFRVLGDRHRHRKQQRHHQRQQLQTQLTGTALAQALKQLDEESRQDGMERRRLKRQRAESLDPLKAQLAEADRQIRTLKQQRRELSRQLQDLMHEAYSLTNFAGQSQFLQELMSGQGIPTGTGDCCAPKLLHYAASQGLRPLAMAEFWWGAPAGGSSPKVSGQFYGACAERCQPLMGFLLSGLVEEKENTDPTPIPVTTGIQASRSRVHQDHQLGESPDSDHFAQIPIIHEEPGFIVINKPADLLSVPGRSRYLQDSVLSRLWHVLPEGKALRAAHRLDRATSGLLLLTRDAATRRHFSQQFQERRIHKTYEAILAAPAVVVQVALQRWPLERGWHLIDLPLAPDLEHRPRQRVDEQAGRASQTRCRILGPVQLGSAQYTRVEFEPLTGRTHQLRVHAVDSQGLGVVIWGDRLYGCKAEASRLHLHARDLAFEHPDSENLIHLHTPTPF